MSKIEQSSILIKKEDLLKIIKDPYTSNYSKDIARSYLPIGEQGMRFDFDKISNGSRVRLFPRENNPIHKKPVNATYADGYFFCDGSKPELGADYYLGDVATYNVGYHDIEFEQRMPI